MSSGSFLISIVQAKVLKNVVEELEPHKEPDDEVHVTALRDGTGQLRVELTSSDERRYINEAGIVASSQWGD